jgi:hypothetical protein
VIAFLQIVKKMFLYHVRPNMLQFFNEHHKFAVLYTVEFQKRGLPHRHIIFWVSTDTSEPTQEFIDSFISAEIPDPSSDPLGYALVA